MRAQRILMALAAAAGALLAQGEEPEDEPGPHDLLRSALRHYRNAPDLVVKTKVKHEKPDLAKKLGGGGNVIVQVEHSGGGPEPFEGTVEAWRDAYGRVVIVSEKEVPGFSLYIGRERTIKRITFERETFGLAQLRAELGTLLEADRFVARIRDAKLLPHRDPATGDITFKGEVDRRIVRRTRGEMAARVIRTEAELVVTKEGRFKKVAVKVVHNNPWEELMGGKMKDLRRRFGVPGGEDDEDEKDEHDVEGGSATYTMTFETKKPSERARRFREHARRLVAQRDE